MNRKRFKNLIEALEKKPGQKIIIIATVILALATLALAAITYFNISETKNMVRATKNLADISVEQFKIKSYPTFIIDVNQCSFDSETHEYKIAFTNRGEITAYKVTFLIVEGYEKESGAPHFVNNVTSLYESKEKITALDHEVDILRDMQRTIITGGKYYHDYDLDKLNHLLLFIRFKVPYDDKYSYEEKAYRLEKKSVRKNGKALYHLEQITKWDLKSLLEKYFILSSKWSDKIKMFFNDYELEEKTS